MSIAYGRWGRASLKSAKLLVWTTCHEGTSSRRVTNAGFSMNSRIGSESAGTFVTTGCSLAAGAPAGGRRRNQSKRPIQLSPSLAKRSRKRAGRKRLPTPWHGHDGPTVPTSPGHVHRLVRPGHFLPQCNRKRNLDILLVLTLTYV